MGICVLEHQVFRDVVLERHHFVLPGNSLWKVLTIGQILAQRHVISITVASGTAHLELACTLTWVRAIDIKFDDRVELSRLLQDLEPVSTFVLLRHKVEVLVIADNLISRLILCLIALSNLTLEFILIGRIVLIVFVIAIAICPSSMMIIVHSYLLTLSHVNNRHDLLLLSLRLLFIILQRPRHHGLLLSLQFSAASATSLLLLK